MPEQTDFFGALHVHALSVFSRDAGIHQMGAMVNNRDLIAERGPLRSGKAHVDGSTVADHQSHWRSVRHVPKRNQLRGRLLMLFEDQKPERRVARLNQFSHQPPGQKVGRKTRDECAHGELLSDLAWNASGRVRRKVHRENLRVDQTARSAVDENSSDPMTSPAHWCALTSAGDDLELGEFRMNSLKNVAYTALLALAVSACDSTTTPPVNNDGGQDSGADGDASGPGTIVQIAASNPDFSILVAAATRANLVEALSSPTGTYTVFAPNNAAFAASGLTLEAINALEPAALAGILTYHALRTEVPSSAITAGPVTSLAMLSLILSTTSGVQINGGNTVTGGANVISADIEASNGVIHVIDRVLLPPDITDLTRYAGLTSLRGALETAELVDDLEATGPFTVFAPSNAAFTAAQSTLAGLPQATVTNALLYHVVDSRIAAENIVGRSRSLAPNQYGDRMTLLFDTADGVRINGAASVSTADIFATNGVVHVIDAVLLPMNAVQAATAAGLTGLTGAVSAAADIPASGGNPATSVAAALSAQAAYTIFAPTNAAFTAAEATILGIPEGERPAAIRDILLFHVLSTSIPNAPILSTELPSAAAELATLNGATASFAPGTPPTIEGAAIGPADLVVTNGVIHLINQVILPPL